MMYRNGLSMNERDFVYWLQGYLELSNSKTVGPEEVKIIKDHITLVLKKVTPSYPEISVPFVQTSPYEITTTPGIGYLIGGDCGFRGSSSDMAKHKITCPICSHSLTATC